MDSEFLKEQAKRCRGLAEKADQFTKRRLLDLAAKYDGRLDPTSQASRTLKHLSSPPAPRTQRPLDPTA